MRMLQNRVAASCARSLGVFLHVGLELSLMICKHWSSHSLMGRHMHNSTCRVVCNCMYITCGDFWSLGPRLFAFWRSMCMMKWELSSSLVYVDHPLQTPKGIFISCPLGLVCCTLPGWFGHVHIFPIICLCWKVSCPKTDMLSSCLEVLTGTPVEAEDLVGTLMSSQNNTCHQGCSKCSDDCCDHCWF